MRKHYPLNLQGVEDAGLLPWTDGVPSTGTQGSYPGHAVVTDTESEILSAIAAAGLPPAGADLTQLIQAVSRGIYLGGFTGSANALSAALPNSLVFPALLRGMRFTGSTAVANTGAVTVTLTGFAQAPGTVQLLGRNGQALQGGDLPVGRDFDFRYDGANCRLCEIAVSELPAAPVIPPYPTIPPVSQIHYGTATGAGPTYTVADLNPPISALADGLLLEITFPAGAVDNPSLTIKGQDGTTTIDTLTLQRMDGSGLKGLDAPKGGRPLLSIYVASKTARLVSAGYAEAQRVVQSPVRYAGVTGAAGVSDANDGLTPQTPKTYTGAISDLLGLNFSSSAATLYLLDGTYTDAQYLLPRGTGAITARSLSGNPDACVLQGAGSPGQGVVQSVGANALADVRVRNTSSNAHTCVAVGTGSRLAQTNVRLESTQTTTGAHNYSNGTANITHVSGCTAQGNAAALIFADSGAEAFPNSNSQIQILGNPTFALATVAALRAGRVPFQGNSSITGACQGKRFFIDSFGIVDTNGGGLQFIPGSVDGYAAPNKSYYN